MTPQTVNAYYNATRNKIVFPAGHPAAAVLRSQRRHGGQLRRHRRGDRPRDHPRLRRPGPQVRRRRRARRLVDSLRTPPGSRPRPRVGAQYAAYEPVPGIHIKGQLTMGENIADLGGVLVALDAYHASLKGQGRRFWTASLAISGCSSPGRKCGGRRLALRQSSSRPNPTPIRQCNSASSAHRATMTVGTGVRYQTGGNLLSGTGAKGAYLVRANCASVPHMSPNTIRSEIIEA